MSENVRRSLLLGILLCAILGAVTSYSWWPEVAVVRPPGAAKNVPAIPIENALLQTDAPLEFQPVPPETAELMNAAVPDYVGQLLTAQPLIAPTMTDSTQRALDCLTAAIYYEARSESPQGQRAVAQVVLNRVRDPVYPASVCGVVFQGAERVTGCQFSFTCDGSLGTPPREPLWERARAVARAALSGLVEPSVGLATHYHTHWVVPVWRTDLIKLRTVGAHIFYGWQGRQVSRRGLRPVYAGLEPPLWPAFAAYATIVPESGTAVDPMAATFASAISGQSGPIVASGVPLAPAATPLSADERRGALVARQSRLKIDDTPVARPQSGGALPK